MASIKCGHCKDTHGSVDAVLNCAMWEAQAEADAAAEQAQIEHERMLDWYDSQDSQECSHGLSAWLCADPVNHYPADNAVDCW